MLKELLDAEGLWHAILLQMVGELAKNSADKVAARYVTDAQRIVKSQGLTKPADVAKATLDMVEQKQGWSNSLVKMALFLAGTTRSQEKAKFAQAALARIQEQHIAEPARMVAETIAVVRAKQDWDSVARRLASGQ